MTTKKQGWISSENHLLHIYVLCINTLLWVWIKNTVYCQILCNNIQSYGMHYKSFRQKHSTHDHSQLRGSMSTAALFPNCTQLEKNIFTKNWDMMRESTFRECEEIFVWKQLIGTFERKKDTMWIVHHICYDFQYWTHKSIGKYIRKTLG